MGRPRQSGCPWRCIACAIMPAVKLREIGEFELIGRMAAVFQSGGLEAASLRPRFPGLAVGIGDDAAVWKSSGGVHTVATIDAMVEGVHFTRSTTGWYDLGWKAMASNISDIAGMGATPRYALVALAAPSDEEVDDVLQLCRGMAELAERYGVLVVGGDTVSAPLVMVTITVVGETLGGLGTEDRPALLSRFAGRPGDAVAVTGRLGSSGGGLALLLKRLAPIPKSMETLLEAHRRPMPRVREGQLLVEAGVRCGMDLSDGLAGDLKRICLASGVDALVEVEKLPIDPVLRDRFGERAIDLALYGGEDYELLCAAPFQTMAKAQRLLQEVGATLTVIGRLVERDPSRPPVTLIGANGEAYAPSRSGWEHFAADGEPTGA